MSMATVIRVMMMAHVLNLINPWLMMHLTQYDARGHVAPNTELVALYKLYD